MLGLWFSMTAKTTMRATVYTMFTTVFLGGGHWIVWLCCGPLFFFAGGGGGRGISEYILKLHAGLTTPAVLALFAFSGQEFNNNWGSREMAEIIGFCILGLFLWGMASFIFWTALLAPRFRVFTGRQDERYPDNYYDPHEDEEEKPRRRRIR